MRPETPVSRSGCVSTTGRSPQQGEHHHLSAVGRACELGAAESAAVAGDHPLGPSGACRPRASMQCPPRHRPTHIQPASGSICRSVGTTGLRTAAVIVVFTCPAGALIGLRHRYGGEVARLVRGRVPAELALAERRRPFVASQLPPRSPPVFTWLILAAGGRGAVRRFGSRCRCARLLPDRSIRWGSGRAGRTGGVR